MKTLLLGVAIAALVLVNAHDIAGAGQVGSVIKPNIRTPRIMVRPPKVTPPNRRLIKKNNPREVTNPAATQGGSAAEAVSPVQSRTPPRLRKKTRVVVTIPRARPYTVMDFMQSIEAKRVNLKEHIGIRFWIYIYRASIGQQNDDKKYWIIRLILNNTIGDALSDYLSDLPPNANQAEINNAMAEEKTDAARLSPSDSLQQSIGMASDTEPCLSRNC